MLVALRLPASSWTLSAGSVGRSALLFSAAVTLFGCGSPDDLIIGSIDFSLVRRDDFDGDALDSDYWEAATHTFDPNLAWFSPDNARVEGGRLVLSVTDTPTSSEPSKSYSAAEVRSRVPFLYGRFRARARFASGAGIISAFWGFYDHYSMSSGSSLENQIVIESGVSEETSTHELRYSVNVPEAGLSEPRPAGFDPSAGFHELGFDWTPTEVTFFVDGRKELVVSGESAARLREYQRLVMSAYPSNAGWLAPFEPAQLPVTAEFDWVEIFEYRGPRP